MQAERVGIHLWFWSGRGGILLLVLDGRRKCCSEISLCKWPILKIANSRFQLCFWVSICFEIGCCSWRLWTWKCLRFHCWLSSWRFWSSLGLVVGLERAATGFCVFFRSWSCDWLSKFTTAQKRWKAIFRGFGFGCWALRWSKFCGRDEAFLGCRSCVRSKRLAWRCRLADFCFLWILALIHWIYHV